jgi:integral membrane protein
MVRFFKIIATLEGLSLLVLFFVAMPLKYYFETPEYVRPVGMAHGILFIGYVVLAFMLKMEQEWPIKKLLLVLVASVIPFGTFYIEWKYFGKQQQN